MDNYTKQIIGYWLLAIMGFFTPFLIGALAISGFDPLLTTFITGVWASTATGLGLIIKHHFKLLKIETSTTETPT